MAPTRLGDYYTNDLLSASPATSMVGNLINETVLTPGQTGYSGAFVMLVSVHVSSMQPADGLDIAGSV